MVLLFLFVVIIAILLLEKMSGRSSRSRSGIIHSNFQTPENNEDLDLGEDWRRLTPESIHISSLRNRNAVPYVSFLNWVLCENEDGTYALYYNTNCAQRSYAIRSYIEDEDEDGDHIEDDDVPYFTLEDFKFLLPYILCIYNAVFWRPYLHTVLSNLHYLDSRFLCHEIVVSTLLCSEDTNIYGGRRLMIYILSFIRQEEFWLYSTNRNPYVVV